MKSGERYAPGMRLVIRKRDCHEIGCVNRAYYVVKFASVPQRQPSHPATPYQHTNSTHGESTPGTKGLGSVLVDLMMTTSSGDLGRDRGKLDASIIWSEGRGGGGA